MSSKRIIIPPDEAQVEGKHWAHYFASNTAAAWGTWICRPWRLQYLGDGDEAWHDTWNSSGSTSNPVTADAACNSRVQQSARFLEEGLCDGRRVGRSKHGRSSLHGFAMDDMLMGQSKDDLFLELRLVMASLSVDDQESWSILVGIVKRTI